jgi:hypothetical protein
MLQRLDFRRKGKKKEKKIPSALEGLSHRYYLPDCKKACGSLFAINMQTSHLPEGWMISGILA